MEIQHRIPNVISCGIKAITPTEPRQYNEELVEDRVAVNHPVRKFYWDKVWSYETHHGWPVTMSTLRYYVGLESYLWDHGKLRLTRAYQFLEIIYI